MSEESEEVKILIQKTLININDVTEKIKREMELINEMVKAKGHLTLTIDEANDTLAKIAKERAVSMSGELSDTQTLQDNIDDLEVLNPVTVDMITQKLMAIMDT